MVRRRRNISLMLDTWVEENTGKHYCQCFCGETIKIKRIYYHAGIPKFKNTHYRAKGKDSPTWKGGITEYRGYVFIKKPEHLRAGQNGYVKRAVLVWEENTKTFIKKGQILHHRNGIKNDDRFENLEVLNRAEHIKKHHITLKQKQREYFKKKKEMAHGTRNLERKNGFADRF